MDITGIDRVVMGVEDFDAASRFCVDFGLQPAGASADHVDFLAMDGTGVTLRRLGDPALPMANVAGSTARETVWGVRNTTVLEQIADRLSGSRQVLRDPSGTLHTYDDDGMGIAFQVTEKQAYKAEPVLMNVAGLPPQRPINTRVAFTKQVRARAMGHIVFWSPDVARSQAFYTDQLGFRLTDSFEENRGAFVRAAGSSEHHNIFFISTDKFPASFQHLEFEFSDFQEVMIGGKHMVSQGWETRKGPGRHELGSNYYWYFKTPMGGAFEFACDMDQVDDAWEPGVWESVATVAGWQTSLADMG
jgi:catechol 2,3-dioxygenase-like lactoylglutathione lyase family enzyme